MTNRSSIPAEIEREILIECGHRCAVCGTSFPLERAHIIPWHESKEHKAEDLICLCANCHEKSHKWDEKTLREYKQKPWVMRQYEKKDNMTDTPQTTVTINIKGLPPHFNETAQKYFVSGLAAYLDIPRDAVHIISVEEGSVKITLELPKKAADALLIAYEQKDPKLYEYLSPFVLLDLYKEIEKHEKVLSNYEHWKGVMTMIELERFRNDKIVRRILSFDVNNENENDGDHIQVSFSEGMEHGPIIERVGNDSPRSRSMEGSDYTTDPKIQRLGSWFISKELKSENLCCILLHLSWLYNSVNGNMSSLTDFLSAGRTKQVLSNVENELEDKFKKPLDRIYELIEKSLFSVNQKFQTELDKRNISEKLRQDFANNNITLSQSATISIEEISDTWQIKDGQRTYIIKKEEDKLYIYENKFRIKSNNINEFRDQASIILRFLFEAQKSQIGNTKVDEPKILVNKLFSVGPELRDDLDDNIISDILKQKFANNNITLSQSATISIEKISDTWQIKDGQQIYIIRKEEEDKINIYENKDFSVTLDIAISTFLLAMSSSKKTKITEEEMRRLKNEMSKWLILLIQNVATPIHLEVFKDCERCFDVIGYQGCGDLSMNLWNVAFIRDICDPNKVHFIFPFDEPVEDRTYTCLVKWKSESLSDELIGVKGTPWRVEIAEIEFSRYVSENSPERVKLVLPETGKKTPIADKIDFAVYGQRIIQNGSFLDYINTILQFSDVRHIFLLPNLNPSESFKKILDGDNKRPRTIFNRRQDDDVWLFEYVLLHDRNLLRAALAGPIQVNASELGTTQDHIESALFGNGPGSMNYYNEVANRLGQLREGDWRKIVEGRNVFYEIYLKRNVYPCSILGITQNGKLISLAWRGAYSDNRGLTIEQAAKMLADTQFGVKDALLIDEGGDVYQFIEGTQDDFQLRPAREQVRAMFIFKKKKKCNLKPS